MSNVVPLFGSKKIDDDEVCVCPDLPVAHTHYYPKESEDDE